MLNSKVHIGEQIPYAIYIKRRKNRPIKEAGANNEYYTPVYSNGILDPDVLSFFYVESQ